MSIAARWRLAARIGAGQHFRGRSRPACYSLADALGASDRRMNIYRLPLDGNERIGQP